MTVEESRERAHLANAGEFNRRYLTCQISAILYADRGDRRKLQSLHRAHAIFTDRGDRRIKSPSVSLVLNVVISRCCFAEDGKEMYQNVERTCRAIVFAH